ncbi:MAG: hypothetical protein HYT82_01445, partial [Candidatus Harrisonbacteria bacterium]|nr:hypothetical protein [Candidatus Harrisonbacteria bacterium]
MPVCRAAPALLALQRREPACRSPQRRSLDADRPSPLGFRELPRGTPATRMGLSMPSLRGVATTKQSHICYG